MSGPVTVAGLFHRIRRAADMIGDPAPIIYTDFGTAAEIRAALVDDLQCRGADLISASDPLSVMQFDGVRVRFLPDRPEVGWREHFGPLADIWSDL